MENEKIDYYSKLIAKVSEVETFSDMVIRLAREKNLTSTEVYKNAGIDAKHYSKIISDRKYQPKKSTVLAFAVGMKLNEADSSFLLEKAGFSFNPSNTFDEIIRVFIKNGVYDRQTIDSVMSALNLPLLPSNW